MTLEQTPQEAPEIINLLRLRGAAGDYYLYCEDWPGRIFIELASGAFLIANGEDGKPTLQQVEPYRPRFDGYWSHNRVGCMAHALPADDETAGFTSQPVTNNAKRPERESRAVLTEWRGRMSYLITDTHTHVCCCQVQSRAHGGPLPSIKRSVPGGSFAREGFPTARLAACGLRGSLA